MESMKMGLKSQSLKSLKSLMSKFRAVTGYGLSVTGAKKDQVKATKRQSDMSFLKGLVGEGMRGLGKSYVESTFKEGVKSRIGITKPRLDSVSILSRQSDLAKYVATLAVLLCLSVGQMWGAETLAISVSEPTASSYGPTNGVTISGTYQNNKTLDGTGSQKVFKVSSTSGTSNTITISSTGANIKKIVTYVSAQTSGTSATLGFDVQTSSDNSTYTVCTSGISISGGASGTTTSSGAGIYVLAYGSHSEVTITFTTPQQYVRITKAATGSNIKETAFKVVSVYTESGSSCTPCTFKSGDKVYFKDQSSNFDFGYLWKVSSGNVYAYFWNDTEDAWSSYGTPVDGDWNAANTIYEITVPGSGKEYQHVIFTRGNNNTCFDCSSTWDKTTNQEPCEGKNLFYVSKDKYADHIYYGSWGNYTPAGKTVYFDARIAPDTWTTAYVRIGHGSNNSAWGPMTKVAGTKCLYSQTTSKWISHSDFAIANKAGWTGSNHIDQPEKTYSNGSWSGSEHKMTMQTNYQQYAIEGDIYICPKATSVLEHGCQFYQVTNPNSTTSSRIDEYTTALSLPSYTVTSSASHCTVTMVKYTADDGSTYDALSSGGAVIPTQYVKVTVTPDANYQFSSVEVTGAETVTAAAAGTPGVYYITGDATITATCTCVALTVNRGGTEATPAGGVTVGSAYGTLTCSASTGVIASYQWKQNTTASTVGAVNAEGSGATTASFSPNPASAGSYYYYCVATDACGNSANTSFSGLFTFNAVSPIISWDLKVNASWVDVDGSTTDGTNITSIETSTAHTTVTDDNREDKTSKLALASSSAGNNYVEFTFFVACGKKLTPDSIVMKVLNVGGGSGGKMTHKAELSDKFGHSINGTVQPTNDGTLTKLKVTNGSSVYFQGAVSLKVWAWNHDGTKGTAFRMGKDVDIYGSVASQSTPSATITWDTHPANGTVGDDDVTIAAHASDGSTVSYTSNNVAVATIVAGKVHYVGAGTTTIQASITDQCGNTVNQNSNSFTVSAGSYTGLSVTKDPSAGSASAPTISATSVTQGSGVTVTAGAAASGYAFTGWTSENGTFASASSLSTTFTPSANNAVATANYAAVKTITLKFLHNGNTAGWVIQGCTTYPSGQTSTIEVSGDWVVLTFSNVYAVSNIDLARSGGDWDYLNNSTKITDDACYNWDGTTRSCDATAPTLVSSDPDDGDTDVNLSGTIVLTFSEEIASVDDTKFTLTGATKGDVAIDGSDATKVNIAYSGASYSSTVTLATAAGAVSDAAGNASAALSSISFTTKAEPTLTALVSGTGYTPANMLPTGNTISTTGQYVQGLSDNTKFFIVGDASRTSNTDGVPEIKTKTDDRITISATDYDDQLYFKGAANMSSSTPTSRAVKFILPSSGTLTIYGNGSDIKLVKDGSSTPTSISFTSNAWTSSTLSSGTYYLYATSGSQRIVYIKFDEDVCSAPTSAVISGGGAKLQYDAIELEASASGTENGVTTYTWYRGNSGEEAAKAAGAIQATSTSGSTYTIAECSTTDAAVYYCVISNGTGCEVTASTSISVTAAYTLTYSANTDDPSVGNMPSQEIHTPGIYTLSSKVPTRNGYTFDGWYYYSNYSGTRYAAGASFTTGALNETLYAKWTPNTYDITYHLNGASWGGGYSAPAEYTVGTGATLPMAGNMTNTGYTFGGWYDNSGLTGSSVTAISTSDYGNKEYWAKWTENTYDVTYNANGGSGSMTGQNGHYVTLKDNEFTHADHIFVKWNTATDGSGTSYSEGEEVELTADLNLYAIWASDYSVTWGDVQIGGAGDEVTPNLGGGNYTITATIASWTGSTGDIELGTVTDGVTAAITGTTASTVTITFDVTAAVVGEAITLTLDIPANGSYGAKSEATEIDIDRCTGGSGGSDGVLFSAEFKDSGLGTSNICTAANTPYEFTTSELKAAAAGGSIEAYTTNTLGHMKFAGNAISIAGSDGVIEITLDNAIATNDLFSYVNVNSSQSSAYLRHTSADNTTDQIALTVYNNKESKVRLTSGFNGKTTLYIVRNNNNFNLHKAAVIRPAFIMLVRDDTPTASSTNLEGTDVELTTSTYLAAISGGRAYYTSPTAGNLKIKRSDSKNYINFNSTSGYVKVVLDDALQEGDVIGFDSQNTNELAFTSTTTRSTSIHTTSKLYTVDASSDLKGKSTFYIWQNSGTSDYLRGLQIARSGVAGGSGGSNQITPTLTWTPALSLDADWHTDHLEKETGDADFTFTVTQDKNSLGAITYASSNTSVATVTSAGKVHIAGAGEATITATMAESGCYEEATASYTITVTDNCEDAAGTITVKDLGCGNGYELTVSGHTIGDAVTYQWYKDGVSMGGSYVAAKCTVTVAGEYYVIVDNTGSAGSYHCAMASDNTITIEATETATATKIVDSWYVKNGRRTPDIALVQTENANGFTVKSGSTVIWNSDGSVTTGFAGCGFYLGTDGIIYLKGQKADGTAPSGLTAGDETLTFIATSCGGNASGLDITIHKQAATDRPSVAFVVDGTKEGDFDAENEDHSVGTALYDYLDYTRNGSGADGLFDLTPQNVYSTVDEKAIRQHYSQFDAIIITDDPSTSTKIGKKSCVDAFGTMIDIRPILTMEAYVSSLSNWKAKGISGNPTSPNPRQYAMKLECKDHAIFSGLNSASDNVEVETVDGVDYWTVTMVDKTKTPYAGLDDDEETGGGEKPALQGFSASNVEGLLLLGEISEGTLYAGVERQDEPAARLMLLGVQYKALPSALTPEGLVVIKNAVNYLLKTDMEEVDDCSNYFTDATGDHKWSTNGNWSKGKAPDVTVKARILKPCIVDGTAYAAQVDIATSGKSSKGGGIAECTGKLTIDPTGALIVGGEVRSANAPYFNTGDLMPTTVNDLVLNTNGSNQSALIFNNDKGDTKATVNLYSLGRKPSSYQYQYFAIPMEYLPVNPTFANETHGGTKIYTYVWEEGTSSWTRRKYYDDLFAFEGLGITTNSTADYMDYTMTGNLVSTAEREITLTYDGVGNNIIGNSYTAPINIASLVEAFKDDGYVTKTVYVYCAGRDAVKGTGASGSTETAGQWLAIPMDASGWEAWTGLKVIPAMQAFLIQVTGETSMTLNYDEMVRSNKANYNEKLRAPQRFADEQATTLTRLRVADNQTHTDLYLFEGEKFSEGFDNGWEATYMEGDGRSAQLYAMAAEDKMAVLATPELEGTQVGFAPGQETVYTFSFAGGTGEYYLNDIKAKKSTLIQEGNTYSFEYENGDAADRFYISKTAIDAPAVGTGVDNTQSGVKVQKFIYQNKLYILRNGVLYDATGKIVK